MESDISSMYAQIQSSNNSKDPTSSMDLFSKLDSLMIRPAIDYVKDGKSDSNRDILSSSNSVTVRRTGSQGGAKRLSDGKPWTDLKPKRIKMEVHKVQPYLFSTQLEPSAPCSSTSGSVMSMDIDNESPSAEDPPVFMSAKGFSTWVIIIIYIHIHIYVCIYIIFN